MRKYKTYKILMEIETKMYAKTHEEAVDEAMDMLASGVFLWKDIKYTTEEIKND
mgnify:FL=1